MSKADKIEIIISNIQIQEAQVLENTLVTGQQVLQNHMVESDGESDISSEDSESDFEIVLQITMPKSDSDSTS